LFLSFFPTIVQGPISRYQALSEQLTRPNGFSYERAKHGIQLMLWGACKKLIIADRAAVLANTVFGDTATYSGTYLAFAVIMYCIQIYGDFSGGIDIATGAAQILGITLDKNFERPYFAKTLPDFWRRWHISLGAWFRDYVFYPLSLSKFFTALGKLGRKIFGNYIGKLLPVLIPQFIIFFLIGFWHGPHWKNIAFGLYNGVLIVLGILFDQPLQKLGKKLQINMESLSFRIFQTVRTFIIVAIGKYFVCAGNVGTAFAMMRSTILHWDPDFLWNQSMLTLGLDEKDLQLLGWAVLVWFLVSLLQEKGIRLRESLSKQNVWFRWLISLAAVFALILFGMYGLNYNPADFIYRGF